MKLKIMVMGSGGQLGQEFRLLSTEQTIVNGEFVFANRDQLDITNRKTITRYFELHKPDYCINCAAYTNVDGAESDRALASEVNTAGVKNLALECEKFFTTLIHYSTDYVFDGHGYKPYKENNPTNPVNYYGQTKLDGEKLAQKYNPKTLIIRTSWVYSKFGKNFVKTITKLCHEKKSLNVIADQIGTPTLGENLAKDTLRIIKELEITNNPQLFGVYNYSNLGVTSWYDFARKITLLQNIKCQIKPIPATDYPTKAKRPYYSVLDKAKIVETFNLEINHWESSLQKMLGEMS